MWPQISLICLLPFSPSLDTLRTASVSTLGPCMRTGGISKVSVAADHYLPDLIFINLTESCLLRLDSAPFTLCHRAHQPSWQSSHLDVVCVSWSEMNDCSFFCILFSNGILFCFCFCFFNGDYLNNLLLLIQLMQNHLFICLISICLVNDLLLSLNFFFLFYKL